jgi:hypothetical protein
MCMLATSPKYSEDNITVKKKKIDNLFHQLRKHWIGNK